MTPETLGYANLIGLAAVLGFLWTLHRDMAAVRERLARLEGIVGVLAGNVDTLMRTFLDRERPTAPAE